MVEIQEEVEFFISEDDIDTINLLPILEFE